MPLRMPINKSCKNTVQHMSCNARMDGMSNVETLLVTLSSPWQLNTGERILYLTAYTARARLRTPCPPEQK